MCVSVHNRDIMTQGDRTRACINPVEHGPAAEISQSQLPFGRLCAGRGMRPYHCHSQPWRHGATAKKNRSHYARGNNKKVLSLTSRIRASGRASTWRIYRRRICKCQSESTCDVTQHIVSDQAPRQRESDGNARPGTLSTATRAVKLNLTHSIDSSYVSG